MRSSVSNMYKLFYVELKFELSILTPYIHTIGSGKCALIPTKEVNNTFIAVLHLDSCSKAFKH